MTKVNKTKNLLERWPEYRKPRKLGKLRTAYKKSEDDQTLIIYPTLKKSLIY